MMARLLHEGGLYLGRAEDIMPPADSNPEGHWENLRFVEINDALLERAGGSWREAPKFETGWERDPRYDDLFDRAKRLVETFADREPWGFKDPRNSLTLPFWRRLLPTMKVVIAVRNPLEVANSLLARNQLPLADGVALWTNYTVRARDSAPAESRLVSHYESYFHDGRGETARLLTFAGLPHDDVVLDRLHALAKEGLRHNRLLVRETVDGMPASEAMRLYFEMGAEAGPVFLRKLAGEALGEPAFAMEATEPRSWFLAEALLSVVARDRTAEDLRRQIDMLNESLRDAHEETATAQRVIDKLRFRLSWWRHRWVDNAANFVARFRGREPEVFD